MDDVLSALVGIEGRYISIRRRVHANDTNDFSISFHVDPSMDLALQVKEKVEKLYLCER